MALAWSPAARMFMMHAHAMMFGSMQVPSWLAVGMCTPHAARVIGWLAHALEHKPNLAFAERSTVWRLCFLTTYSFTTLVA
jgi:hypothetical protein